MQGGGEWSISRSKMRGATLDLIDVVAPSNGGAPQSMLSQPKGPSTTIWDGA